MAPNVETGTFPYSPTGIGIPRTDGIMSDQPGPSTIFLPAPGEMTVPDVPSSVRGTVKEYYGDTQCVDTNTTGHTVFTGSF
jgi:hypothetical protein